MDKILFDMRFTAKQLLKESAKSEKKQKAEEKKVMDCIQKGTSPEFVRVHGANAVREKNQALNYMRLSSRIDAVAARVETALKMNQLNKQIGGVMKGMDKVLGSMDVEKISKMMDDFEKQFQNLDVRAAYMESAMASSTASSVPEDEVDALISMVREQHKADLGDAFSATGVGSGAAVGHAAAAAPARVAEAAAAGAAGAPKPTDAPVPPSGRPGEGDGGAGGGGSVASSLAARLAALRR